MREIKFRGKRKGEPHEWLVGNLQHIDGSVYVFPTSAEKELNSADWYEVIPKTVGQYTGLKDKNDKEIWEGDMLKGNHKDLFLIEEFNGGLQMYNSRYYGQKHNELIAAPTCDLQTKSWLNNAEVIGNIHDNPELLKDGTT